MFVIEKLVIDKMFYSPFFIIGVEGIIGTISTTIAFFILRRIPCDNNSKICDYTSINPNNVLEDFLSTFSFMFQDKDKAIWFIMEILGRFFHNLFGILTLVFL